ncbi:MAG: PstS family phosphate ABC transporter substrate-binding protein [Dehalococcoidia bacterium]
MYNTGMKGKWLPLAIAVLLMTAVVLGGCDGASNGDGDSLSFSITGSNTVQPLSVVWAEDFMGQRPEVSIAVSGPGSGVGIAALIDGTTEVAQASRKIKQSEIDAATANGVNPYEIQVATDALAVVVHPSNSVTELTYAQLSAIYTNQITNWQELGGADATIVAIARDTNSGTHVFFKETVVQMRGLPSEDTSLEYGPDVLQLPSTSAGIDEVTGNPNAIFYAGLAYVTGDVASVAIKERADDTAVLPSVETATDGTYVLVRPLLYYTDGQPSGVVKDFIDYCLSTEGQAKVLDVGYVPVQ